MKNTNDKQKTDSNESVLCGKRDLNPYGVNHTPLKRARLPVPPLPLAIAVATLTELLPPTLNIIPRVTGFVKGDLKSFLKFFLNFLLKFFSRIG